MGEGRYRTLLCLIQLAIPASSPERESEDAGERILVVDPLPEDFDGSALAEVLADPAIADRRARRAPGHRARAPAL